MSGEIGTNVTIGPGSVGVLIKHVNITNVSDPVGTGPLTPIGTA